MQKWKITKGSEENFIGAPEWCTQVTKHEPTGTLMWEQNFGVIGCKYQTQGKDFVWELDETASNEGFVVIAERVPVEDIMAIPRGWLVNGKFTEDDRYAKWATEHGYEVIAIHNPMAIPSIVDIILETSINVQGRPVRQVYKKLCEEVGEIGDALLAIADGAMPDELVEGEVADVIICAVDLLFVHLQKEAGGRLTDKQVAHEVQNLLEDRVKAKTAKWAAIDKRGEYL